jgi:hypothetical protein
MIQAGFLDLIRRMVESDLERLKQASRRMGGVECRPHATPRGLSGTISIAILNNNDQPA